MTPEEHIPVRLKRARKARGMTQTELAGKADLTPAAISQFEAGERLPSYKSLRAISKALRVSADWLMGKRPADYKEFIGKIRQDPIMREMLKGLFNMSETHKDSLFLFYKYLKEKD